MARFNGLRNNFSLGEVSPATRAKSDVPQFQQMCEVLTNFIPRVDGGVERRKGSQYVANEATNGTVTANSYWFEYKHYNGENYLIHLTDGKALFYRPSTDTWAAITNLEGTYGTNYSLFHTTISSAERVKYAQSAQYGGLLFITNGYTEPVCIYASADSTLNIFRVPRASYEQLDGTGNLNFSVGSKIVRNMPWLDENLSAVTITPSAATGNITLTASAATFTSDMAPATVTGAYTIGGSYFRIRSGSTVGVAQVTSYVSSTVLNVAVLVTLPGTAAYTAWSESAWSRRRGWPRAVTFKGDRIIWAGSESAPETIWGSQLNDIWEMADPDPATAVSTKGTNGSFTATLSSAVRSKINFAVPDFDLFLGSENRETTVGEQDPAFSLGITNVKVKPQTKTGTTYLPPVTYESAITYVDKTTTGIKESVFDFKINAFQAEDILVLSNHLFNRNNSNYVALGYPAAFKYEWIQKIAYQTSEKILWVVAGYNLYSCRRDRQNQFTAWSKHILGGQCDRSDNGFPSAEDTLQDPVVTDICVVASNDYRKTDEVYIRVTRETAAGAAKNYIEKITRPGTGDIVSVMGDFLDCSIGATHSAQLTWTNLAPHLASQTVHVVADGFWLGPMTLTAAGTLVLTTAASEVWVGYHSDSVLVPVQLESNSLFGTGLGPIKRVEEITIIWERTINALVGVQSLESQLDRINFRTMDINADDPTPLFSGQMVPYKLVSDYENKLNIMIKQDRPLPMTVLAIASSGVLYD